MVYTNGFEIRRVKLFELACNQRLALLLVPYHGPFPRLRGGVPRHILGLLILLTH